MPFGFDINEAPDCDLKELHHLISRNVTRFASEHPEMADFAIEIRCDGDMIEWFRRFGMTEKMFFNSLPSMGGGNHFVEYDENAGLESTPMHPRYSPLSSPIFALRGKAEM